MYSFLVVLVTILLISSVFCKNVPHRDPRFIRGTYTTTLTNTVTLTKSIPSSCVHVAATLPPCRNVRFMRFPFFGSNQIDNDARPQQKSEESIYTTPLGWGEYIGIYAPTATVNVTEFKTTEVQDPRIVVTFAVKGCRPMQLPINLNRCPQEYSSSVAIREILPTSTVAPISPTRTENPVTPKNTKVIDLADVPAYGYQNVNDIQGNEFLQDALEGTKESVDNLETTRATEPLP